MKDANLKNALRAVRERYARKTAIVSNGVAYSYSELNKLIRICKKAIARSDTTVLINVDNRLKAIILILSAIDCDVTFIPIDSDRPDSFLKNITGNFAKIRIINDVCLETGELFLQTIEHHYHTDSPGCLGDEGVMSIMYTSGSTGKPKGVLVRSNSVFNLFYRPSFISLSDEDVVASYSSLSFDASTFEIFSPLLAGGTLVLFDKMAVLDEEILVQFIERYKISCMWMTAGLFRNHMLSGYCRALTKLKHLITGGDRVDHQAAVAFLESTSFTKLYHAYGPTENTVFTTISQLELSSIREEKRLPIGKLVQGVDYLLYDEDTGHYLKTGVGHLYVSGKGLSAGYHNNPTETDKAFCTIDNTRYYDTGDVVEYTENGEFYFLGRQDRQVKLNGHRVELDDIEKNLENDELIVKALCFMWQEHLVALIESKNKEFELESLISRARSQLSAYAIPDFFIENNEWPLSKNNKVDTKYLINNTIKMLENRQNKFTSNSVKSIAEEILGKCINHSSIGLFDIGFDSLSILTLSHNLSKSFDIKITLLDLYSSGTLEEVENLVMSKK
ncbi:non-ribosomal peptide synthetase [Photorhabdus viridis]|uniref:non-ribosomal peptide synthetase n=1 Tax=Photorhabdus viridis TaxID=3163327 RepID=UPI003307BF26